MLTMRMSGLLLMAAPKKAPAKKKRREPGAGGLFQRASDGMWVGSVDLPPAPNGERRQKRVYGKTKEIARDRLDELQDKVKAGLVIASGTTTVKAWLNIWLNQIKKPNVSQSTYKFYEETVRLHIVPVMGHVRLDKLTALHIYPAIAGANSTRNAQRVHLVLNMALKKAVDDGLIARNVCKSINKPGHTAKEQDTLSIKDAGHIYTTAVALESRPGYTGPSAMSARWATALWTGARPAEIRGLEWDRVDFTNGLFDLSWQLKQMTMTHGCGEPAGGRYPCGRKYVSYCPQAYWDIAAGYEYRECTGALLWTRPKTDKGKRAVPVVVPLLAMLQAHRDATADQPNPHNLVWHHRDGRPIAEKQEWEFWTDLLDAAGVARVDQYATRHTTGTLLDQLGVSEDVRMQIMGHSSKVAHKAYMHVDQTRTRAALDQLAQHLVLPA